MDLHFKKTVVSLATNNANKMKSISCQEDVGLASSQSNNQQVITFISETVESTKKRLKAQHDRDCQHVPSNGIKKLRVRKQIKIPKLLENFFVFKTCSPCTNKSHSLTTRPLTSACDVTSKNSQKSRVNPSHEKETLEITQSISNCSDSFYLGFPLFIISNSHNITRPNNIPTISTCNQDNTFNSSLQATFSPIIHSTTHGDEWRGLLPLLDAQEVMREWEDLNH